MELKNKRLSIPGLASVTPFIFLGTVFLFPLAIYLLTDIFRSQLYFVLKSESYLLFHNIVELFSIITSFAIFLVGSFTYRQSQNKRLYFLGCVFFGVGLLDLMHLLSFPGMPAFITPSSTNKGILFWISARLLFAVSMLLSVYIPRILKQNKYWRLGIFSSIIAICSIVFFSAIFHESDLPAMFIVGSGLTQFKIILEYTVIVLLCLSYIVYLRLYLETKENVIILYLAAITLSIFSELSFTLYKSAYDTFNFLGHIFKFIAFCFIYDSIFIAAIKYPYDKLSKITSELKLEKEKLKELDTLKDNFLSVTTHELQSPLVPIKSQAQLLLREDYGKLNKDQKSAIEMIYRNEESLGILTREILDITKIKSKKLKLNLSVISIGNILTNSIKDMEIFARDKNITISVKPLPKIPGFYADATKIGEVITNLLSNAIKFTPENGQITIEAKTYHNEIVVIIKDSGIGLSQQNLSKLFTPFFQVDSTLNRKYRGTGLGLALSKGIIEAHGGKIWAESEGEGKGSTFSFSLPIKKI